MVTVLDARWIAVRCRNCRGAARIPLQRNPLPSPLAYRLDLDALRAFVTAHHGPFTTL